MDSINVSFILLDHMQNYKTLFEQCTTVENVNPEFHCAEIDQVERYLSKDHETYVVTNNPEHIEACRALSGAKLVFCGNAGELKEPFPDHLTELWPENESDAVVSFRFHRLYENIKNDFEQWLYHNWLMATIDSMPDMVWYKDASGLHWLVNHKFEDTVQKTRDQVRGKGHNYIWDVPPEDAGKSEFRCLESEREVMEKQKTCVADEHVKTANGVLRHFITYKSPLFARDGKIMGTVGIGHDVTDLSNASLENKLLLENLPFAIMVCDMNWKPISVNSEFKKRFQISRLPNQQGTICGL